MSGKEIIMNFGHLGNEQYIALETFRKSGEGVITPVWITPEDGKLYVWTVGDSWKVKRIRNDNHDVRMAASDARGNPKSEWVEGMATVLDSPGADKRAKRERLSAKYGMKYQLFGLMAKLRGNSGPHVALEIREPSIEHAVKMTPVAQD